MLRMTLSIPSSVKTPRGACRVAQKQRADLFVVLLDMVEHVHQGVGAGVTGIVMNVLAAFFVAVGTASVALASRRHGAGDDEGVKRVVASSALLALCLGAAVGLLCGLFAEPLIAATGLEGRAAEAALPYFVAVSVPSVFLSLQMAASSCMRALEDTRTPLLVSGAANLANIVLNAAAMAAGLGLLGLGLATSVSRGAAAAALVLRLIALFQPFAALVQVVGSALQGAGDTKFPLYATILGIWAIRLGAGAVLSVGLGLGLLGVWCAYALDLVVRGCILARRFSRGAWATLKL